MPSAFDQITILIYAAFIGGIFVLVGRIVWDWLSRKKNGQNNKLTQCLPDKDCKDMIRKTCNNSFWLREVHAKTDDNGVPIWYVPRELISTLRLLHESRNDANVELKNIKVILTDNKNLLQQMLLNK